MNCELRENSGQVDIGGRPGFPGARKWVASSARSADLSAGWGYNALKSGRKWPWVKTKPPKPAKPPQPWTTVRAGCNARFLLREVHDSGALTGACTGKGPQMANPRPTPKPGNLGPPWPPVTSGNPAGYSRGRPLGGSRLSLVRSGSPGAEPPGYELHMGLDKAPPRTRE